MDLRNENIPQHGEYPISGVWTVSYGVRRVVCPTIPSPDIDRDAEHCLTFRLWRTSRILAQWVTVRGMIPLRSNPLLRPCGSAAF